MRNLPEVCQDLLKNWKAVLEYLRTTAPEHTMQDVRHKVDTRTRSFVSCLFFMP